MEMKYYRQTSDEVTEVNMGTLYRTDETGIYVFNDYMPYKVSENNQLFIFIIFQLKKFLLFKKKVYK